MDRRGFLGGALAALGGLPGVSSADAKGNQEKAALKLSSQSWRVPGRDLREKVLRLEQWGAAGVEIHGSKLPAQVDEVKRALKGTSIRVSALCGGRKGVIISPDNAVRRQLVERMKELLTAAGELGASGQILVPAFNRQEQLPHREARRVMVDLLGELGEHARREGTTVLLEPLSRKTAFFLRQLADAASICRDVGSPGAAMMGDFYHMYLEETSDLGAILSAGRWLHHVHLASGSRTLPGQDDRSFVQGFRGLKLIGYRGYCSLECDIEGDPLVEIPKSFEFLRRQWQQATVGDFGSLIDLRSEA